MREIKCRVWDPEEREMHQLVNGIDQVDQEVAGVWELLKLNHDYGWPLTQYTGLKDNNGKEIYEGDILERRVFVCGHEHNPQYWPRIDRWAVEFAAREDDNGGLWLGWNVLAGNTTANEKYKREGMDYEVIGNIYENPELVEP